MKLLNKKENIGNWQMFSNKCYINQNSFVLELDNNNPIVQLNDYWGINFYATFFNVYTNKSLNTLYDYSGSFLKTFEKKNFYYFYSEDEFIFYDKIERKSFYNNEFICDGKILNLYLDNISNLFFARENYLSLYIKHRETVWQFSLSQLSSYITDEGEEKPIELVSIIGVYKNTLWILVTNRKIIGIDVEKGILLHEIDLCKELGLAPNTIENFNFSLKDVHLDEEKGFIKSLSYRYYWEMNLETLQIKIKKDFGEKSDNTWRINRSKYYSGDNNLYFIGTNKGEVVNRAVGVFDTEKLEVVWYDTPLEEKKYLFFTDVPQASTKSLAVLDSENNLRIYERD